MEANRQVAPDVAPAATPQSAGSFVINLCSSTTPMALAKPKDASLARFTFFVSRRREDGRERFRLHMGYFPSMAAAEQLLPIVREVYPSAWAGEAPGRKLKPAAAPAVSDSRQAELSATAKVDVAREAPQAPPPEIMAPAKVDAPPPSAVALALTPEPPRNIPTVHAAPAVRAKASRVDAPEAVTQTTTAPPVPKTPAPVAAAPAVRPSAGKASATAAKSAGPAAAPGPAAPAAPKKPATRESNIREVIAELDELSDTGTLRMLEGRALGDSGRSSADDAIPLVKPEDTQTMQAIKADVQRKAPVSFAVQLDWSVQPIDLQKVPPLAIFNAYTLYTTEANRDGRRWYGLRLGFFSDAISAKQVAYYVRSDFASVAVVPVSSDEKQRATASSAAAAADAARLAASESKAVDEFQLLEDDTPKPIVMDVIGEMSPRASVQPAASAAKPAAPQAAARSGHAKATKSRLEGRATTQPARAKASAKRLDETLEILGADDLEIDSGRGELISDSGVRHLRVHVDKRTSKFTSLLDRLAAKLGRGDS